MATTSTAQAEAKSSRNGAANSNDIEAQIAQLREDIASLAKTVAAVGNAKAEEVKGKARRAANEAADASISVVEAAREQAVSFERDLEKQIRTNPIQSVAIAAGIGFVFALLTRR